MKALILALHIILVLFLTVLTQIGGVVYLLSLLFYGLITKREFRNKAASLSFFLLIFSALYSVFTFMIIPSVSGLFGRVPLPVSEKNGLQPLTSITFILNRHYVKPELYASTLAVSKQMKEKFPGTVVNYLDANFPFFNGFPLIPHLSHNDGEKLDLAFCYRYSSSGEESNESPSVIGYGVCVEPEEGEEDMAQFCSNHGYWQYSFLTKLVPQGGKENLIFDQERTRALVAFFAEDESIGKIFIEPHLKKRMDLNSGKACFHGCGAVRHDDHIHVQLMK